MRENTKYRPENKSILDEYFKIVTDIFVRVIYNTIPIQINMYQINYNHLRLTLVFYILHVKCQI